jgi:hypothetical protein
MARDYEMLSTSRQSALLSDVVLRETATTRLIARPEIVENDNAPEAGVRITFIHQRRSMNAPWSDIPSDSLGALKAGEGFRLHLDSATTLRLRKCLDDFYAISTSGGVRPGRTTLTVAQANEIIRVDRDRAEIIKSLLQQGYPEEVWDALVHAKPDLATSLSYARIYADRATVLAEFEDKLKQRKVAESWWQSFFEQNKWIFGYGLNYLILRPVGNQPRYGGLDVRGKGLQKGDFLEASQATIKFTVLVEIKRPDAPLLKAAPYRAGAWQVSDDLAGGTAQVQANCHTWELEGSRTFHNAEVLAAARIFTVQPKGILVIGHLHELDDIDKRTSFQLFRRNMANPEIITFDELFERAKFITEHVPEK